jgi:hypothetical protein
MANKLFRKKSLFTILEDRKAGFADIDTEETGS